MTDLKTVTFDASQYQLVPIDPTVEMIIAIAEADQPPSSRYSNMLAAAPTPAVESTVELAESDCAALLGLADRIEEANESPIPISLDGALLLRLAVSQIKGEPNAEAAAQSTTFDAWIESIPPLAWESWGRREAAHAAWLAAQSADHSGEATEKVAAQSAGQEAIYQAQWHEGDSWGDVQADLFKQYAVKAFKTRIVYPAPVNASEPMALRTIAEWPISDPANQDAVNMREVARKAIEVAPVNGGERDERLRKFLNAAAGDGYVFDGVDAADLYVALFPHEYETVASQIASGSGFREHERETDSLTNRKAVAHIVTRKDDGQRFLVFADKMTSWRKYPDDFDVTDLYAAPVNGGEQSNAINTELLEALESIQRYGLDTLSGRVDGPDDREWQRESVNEMTKRARLAIERIDAAIAANQSSKGDE